MIQSLNIAVFKGDKEANAPSTFLKESISQNSTRPPS